LEVEGEWRGGGGGSNWYPSDEEQALEGREG